MTECAKSWAEEEARMRWDREASRIRANAAAEANMTADVAAPLTDDMTPFGMGSNTTPIREAIIAPLMSTRVRQAHSKKWRALCGKTITPRASEPEPPEHKRLCSSTYGPGKCERKLSNETKLLFTSSANDVDLITGALGKLAKLPIFSIVYQGALSAAAQSPNTVALLLNRTYLSPPEYSALRLLHSVLPGPGDVIQFSRDILKRHDIAMQMSSVPRAWKYFRHDYEPVVGADGSLCFQILSSLELVPEELRAVPLKRDALATALSTAGAMFKPERAPKPKSLRPAGPNGGRGRGRGGGRGRSAPGEGPGVDSEDESDAGIPLDEWEEEEDDDDKHEPAKGTDADLLMRLSPDNGHVVNVDGDWVGTINTIYAFSSPIWSLAVFCRQCGGQRRTTQNKSPSKVKAIQWVLDCDKFGKRQSDHLAAYDRYVILEWSLKDLKDKADARGKAAAKAAAKAKADAKDKTPVAGKT